MEVYELINTAIDGQLFCHLKSGRIYYFQKSLSKDKNYVIGREIITDRKKFAVLGLFDIVRLASEKEINNALDIQKEKFTKEQKYQFKLHDLAERQIGEIETKIRGYLDSNERESLMKRQSELTKAIHPDWNFI